MLDYTKVNNETTDGDLNSRCWSLVAGIISAPGLILNLRSCKIVNESLFSENPDDDMNYEFLIGGCPNPDEPDTDSLQIISNGQAAAASFSLASFMFHENLDAEIYLHCEVKSFCAFL